jgi:hypothetical protein
VFPRTGHLAPKNREDKAMFYVERKIMSRKAVVVLFAFISGISAVSAAILPAVSV